MILSSTNIINKIMAAKSIEELNQIDVKATYEQRLREIEEERRREEALRAQRELELLKEQVKANVTMAFEPLLAMPLPDELKSEVVKTMDEIIQKIDEAQSKEAVLSIDPTPYLLNLWKQYYYYRIDTIPTQKVILKKGQEMRIYTKQEAKVEISKINDLAELLSYEVEKVEYVQIALLLTRDNVVGGFLQPGDKIKIYAMNGTKFVEIAPEGYVVLPLLSTDAGMISVSESQSQSTSISSSATTSTTDTSSTSYTPGDNTLTISQQKQEQHSTSQVSSESVTASYSYTVDLSEILKAIAAGKIKTPEEVREQLKNYGWRVLDLEEESGFLALPPNTLVLVVVEVPKEFVPDILNYRGSIVIAKIVG
ncbi:DUF515 domain-containing protein [Pyrococcus yayanosii]|uniref:DUF515 domain-containing protein n=1 Tax=Pyrococcus yayanosii TaxID=1008460 RepID=UPI000AF432DD|nr:DUF515 domain-containing protein [Pyrococcus yayanosii]